MFGDTYKIKLVDEVIYEVTGKVRPIQNQRTYSVISHPFMC